MYLETISQTGESVAETLKDLRREVEPREEINEKATLVPVSSLTKHQVVLKVERLTKQNQELKQEGEECKVLDMCIKKENAQLKEKN